MKISINKFRSLHLFVIFNVWVLLILYNERIVPRQTSKRCQWPRDKGYDLLLVADPQLIDEHTYPGRPGPLLRLAQHVTNNYLYKNYLVLLEVLKPKSVVFLGDYLDNGRLDFEGVAQGSTKDHYQRELSKFKFIFGDTPITNLPGNHDIGWENGVSEEALERFHKNFGLTNVVVEKNSHDLILLDTLSLSNTINDSIHGPPAEFVEKIASEEKINPRILFTHVPLWKLDPTKCGSFRESAKFPVDKGFQYQTMLSESLSHDLLVKLKPDLIFSGDDHDYCEYVHTYQDDSNNEIEVVEITVKSISMAMGIKKPAVQLLSLYENPIESGKKYLYNICYLPKPYNEVVIYCSLAFATVVSLILAVLMRSGSMSLGTIRHGNLYTKEAPVSYARLSSYLENSDEQEIDFFAADDLRGSYTYHTTNFTENVNRKKNHSRFNWSLAIKHVLILSVTVFAVYWIFVKDVLYM